MRNYSYFAMPRAKTVNLGLESLSSVGSKLWDLNMLLKLGNLICAHADFAKFIYKLLDICSQQEKNTYMYTKIHICLGKSEYHNRFFLFPLRCTLTFLYSYLFESIEFI